ncbi:MAG: hypothetical protein K2G85_00840 [Muribaculaceae bacterium]|nr:hypothetical protein [Muribaculaceae bacterium]
MQTKEAISCCNIKSSELIADIRSAAWLESELHTELDRHRRHEMADVCEEGNIDYVWRLLALGVAELRIALSRILCHPKLMSNVNDLETCETWDFRFRFPVQSSALAYMKEKIHAYLVAAVMANRMEVIIPSAAAIWRERASEDLSALRLTAATMRPPQGVIRRAMWPL